MAAINARRVWLGGLVGGVVFVLWSILIGWVVLMARYEAAQKVGHYLAEPRYRLFMLWWVITILLIGVIMAWLYAIARGTCGPGPKTALKIGLLVGFIAGFPMALSQATWSPVDRVIPLWQLIESWGGIILATLVAGWLYKE